jgi:hypothetical protein
MVEQTALHFRITHREAMQVGHPSNNTRSRTQAMASLMRALTSRTQTLRKEVSQQHTLRSSMAAKCQDPATRGCNEKSIRIQRVVIPSQMPYDLAVAEGSDMLCVEQVD